MRLMLPLKLRSILEANVFESSQRNILSEERPAHMVDFPQRRVTDQSHGVLLPSLCNLQYHMAPSPSWVIRDMVLSLHTTVVRLGTLRLLALTKLEHFLLTTSSSTDLPTHLDRWLVLMVLLVLQLMVSMILRLMLALKLMVVLHPFHRDLDPQ